VSSIDVIWNTAAAVLASLGGGVVLVFVFSSWLGKVWATRIADSERARFARELEVHRSELGQLAETHRDSLVRKRDVYSRLSTSMRVFLATKTPASDSQKQEFLSAFDHAALWASEDVAIALAAFLECSVRNTANQGSVSNEQFKDAYRACLNAMRRDCGFPETRFNYPVVTF
jgi:hypothetical protein